MARRIIELAQRVVEQGNSITVRWTPAHVGVEGNERADRAAKDAASLPPLRATCRHFSLAYLRRRTTERATQRWRRYIEERNAGRRSFQLPAATSRPGIRPRLRGASKSIAARFFQLLSGHALIAPFLKERWGGQTRTFAGGAVGAGRVGNTSLRSVDPGRKRS